MYDDLIDRNEAVIRGASVLRWRELLKATSHQTRNDTLVNLYRDRMLNRRAWPEYLKGLDVMQTCNPMTQWGQ